MAFAGLGTMTGARLARAARRYLAEAPHFGVTYGDGLTDADLGQELAFHLGHDRLGTVLCVQPPSQFGRLALHEDGSASFAEKPRATNDMVNGGFFFFRRGFLDCLSTDANCVLEREPLQRLTRIWTTSGLQARRLLVVRRHPARSRGGAGSMGVRRRTLARLRSCA